MSRMRTSGLSDRHSRSASSPAVASPTTRIFELQRSESWSRERIDADASAMRTRMGTRTPLPVHHRLVAVVFRGALHASVSYTHLRAHETPEHLVCRLL